MSDFGIIFCGNCHSEKVDSGFDTPSTLKCCECNNGAEFKIGKVGISSGLSLDLDEIIAQAKRDAQI